MTATWDGVSVAAERYERDLVPVLFTSWARDLIGRAEPRPGDHVLDLACGTGIVSRLTAPRLAGSGSICAVDVNPNMLELARRVCHAVRPPIQWRRASALDTGLPDAFYDVVFCQQGLQFIADRSAALREIRRVTAPGGRVAVSVWTEPDNPAYAPFLSAFERHLPESPQAAGFVRAIFALHDPREIRDLLFEAGFTGVEVTRRTDAVRFPTARAWVEAFIGAAPIQLDGVEAAVKEALVEDAVAALAPLTDGEGLSFSISANIAVARA